MAAKVRSPIPSVDWTTMGEEFPCPDVLWQGVWKEVGDKVGQSWDVWMATYIALGAVAQRHLWWYYYRAPVYGMGYGLVVAPTGAGKEFCLNVTSALLPAGYVERDSVQSGQGLFPLLCNVDAKTTIKPATPLLLLLSEWNKLIHMGGIQHSTLIDDLNALFHRSRGWNLSRSDRGDSGGDRLMTPPILSILGTTTPENLLADVDDVLVNRGFLNRYLVLPGPTNPWVFWPDTGKTDDPVIALSDIRTHITECLASYSWGNGKDYQLAFSSAASSLLRSWGEDFFPWLMRQSGAQANRKKRLHVYAHQIALLAAWSRQALSVSEDDVAMAIAVVNASHQFIDRLWGDEPIPLTTVETGDFKVEQLILARVRESPDRYDKASLRESLRRQAIPYAKISKVLDQMVKADVLVTNPESMRLITMEELRVRKLPHEKGNGEYHPKSHRGSFLQK